MHVYGHMRHFAVAIIGQLRHTRARWNLADDSVKRLCLSVESPEVGPTAARYRQGQSNETQT